MATKTTFILEADEAKAVGAFLKVVDAQDKTIAKSRQMSREGQKASKSMGTGFGSVARILGGLSIPAAFMQSIRKVVQEMEAVTALQKEMMGEAVKVEKTIMKIAHLHGDVSAGGRAIQRKRVGDIAKETAYLLKLLQVHYSMVNPQWASARRENQQPV